jgi:penicillin-binding protein-related factor A (putative recombinase)
MTTAPKAFTEAANKGKVAEKKVATFLKAWSDARAGTDWHRVYDAHSSGGRFNRVVYDYAFFGKGFHGGIEVKEVAHGYLLPHKNFGLDQVAKLRKRQLAGGLAIVLVYHSTTKLWRVVPLSVFLTREKGSWHLGDHPVFSSCADALNSTGAFA